MRLIDADALKGDYVVTSTTTNSLCNLYVSMEQIAMAPTVKPASQWHRVEEPPKEHMWCFVYTDEPDMIMPIRIAFYVASCTGKGSWYHYEGADDISDEVDFWTPMTLEGPSILERFDLPWPIEPPKEDA